MNNNEEKKIRLSQVARKLNVGTDTIVAFLEKKGFVVENKPNAKVTVEQFDLLAVEFVSAGMDKQEAAHVTIGKAYTNLVAPVCSHASITKVHESEEAAAKDKRETKAQTSLQKTKRVVKEPGASLSHYETAVPILPGLKTVGKVKLMSNKVIPETTPGAVGPVTPTEESAPSVDQESTSASLDRLNDIYIGEPKDTANRNKITFPEEFKRPTVVGKMILPERVVRRYQPDHGKITQVKPSTSVFTSKTGKGPADATASARFVKKAGLFKATPPSLRKAKDHKRVIEKVQGVSSQEIETQIKKTLARLHQSFGDGTRAKYKKDKRSAHLEAEDKRQRQQQEEAKVLKITEFISASELASFMGVTVNEVLSTCMSLGMVISINQRLDAETITVVADEFGYNVEFVDVYNEEEIEKGSEEATGELVERPPIVTIMGHVDHGKTSLLDYIRKTKVTAKEAGGITQHIGAYDIVIDPNNPNKRIVFLDTPGHEAFTAMRTRGASITDIVVIVVAADDSIMTQTKESISHAQVAGCPIIIAINKMDKPQANPEKVKEDLANLNILVEDWGGKYQCQEISAKTGQGINVLLDKILLEASLLELKATPANKAKGTIIESFLDPGRGYVATGIVQDGTLHMGDIMLAGVYYGRVKALLNHQGLAYQIAPPATPVQILGLNGAPRAGDTFRVMHSMKEVGELAQKKQQVLREQSLRTKAHLTLDEIGRRLAVGNFKELNIIIKGDVDGSIEALSGSLLNLSHEEVHVKILHKCVGAVSESDVLLAAATGAIIISFHIKPSAQVKKLAEKEGVTIKQYAIIYAAIDDIRHIVQGLLAPTIEEMPTGRAEIKKIFPISKIGNIAGCQVQTGFISYINPIRLLRKQEVVFTGVIHTLKHGLEEVKQAKAVSECGIHIKNYDAIEVGDIIEGFERKEIKRSL